MTVACAALHRFRNQLARRHLLRWIAIVGFFAHLGTLYANEDPEIRIALGADEVFISDTVDFQVEIRNVKNPSTPDVSALKEQFDVVANGDESRNQSSIFIINGRRSQQNTFSHVYRYRLIPKETGLLAIPAITQSIDGVEYTSNRLSLKVIAAEIQDLVLVEIKSSHSRVYPTQPFTVTARILVQPLPNDDKTNPLRPLRGRAPHLQVNWVDAPAGLSADDKAAWLQPLVAEDGVGFTLNDLTTRSGSFFEGPRLAVFNLLKGRETRDALSGGSIHYFAYELSRTFTPERTGVFQLGPVSVKGTFVSGMEGREYTGRRLVSIAPATSIEVREVPTPRPATYCGGIGDYKLEVTASPVKLRVGDPLTLTLSIERGSHSGSLDLISAPDLSAIPQFDSDFELIDKQPTGRIEGANKVFSYALRPKRPGVSIPPLAIVTFDPASESFTEIRQEAIPLEVSDASRVNAGDLVGTMPGAAKTDLRTRAEGIFQNITDPSLVHDQQVHHLPVFLLTISVWVICGCVVGAAEIYRRRSSDTIGTRRQQARRAANHQLALAKECSAAGQHQEAFRHIRRAVIGLIADTRNLVADGLTRNDVESELSAASVDSQDRSDVLHLLESLESAEYGGHSFLDVPVTISQATELIARIGSKLERGVRR